MPTVNRPAFVAQSIKYFQAQTYPNKELLIVDESLDATMLHMHRRGDIRYITIAADMRLPLGTKRNLACALAQGELITHWDDDDYYGPHRLSKQAEPILAGKADCSAMRMSLLFDASKGELWECSDMTHKLCFKQDIQYGTLMFKASYWRGGMHFANANIGEDRRFVHALLAADVQIARIVDPSSFIYVLHGKNTTSDMREAHPDGWHNLTNEPYFSLEQYFSEEDIKFYETLKGVP